MEETEEDESYWEDESEDEEGEDEEVDVEVDAEVEVVDRWLQYLQLHAVPGVGMRIVRWYRAPLGFGNDIEVMKEVEEANMSDKAKVEEGAGMVARCLNQLLERS